MSLLVAGIILWAVVHLFPSTATARRDGLIARLGHNAYRGLFALLILAAIVIIVFGWKAAQPVAIYAPPLLGSPIVPGLMLLAFVLFIAAQARTNIKRMLRHPQLTGVVIWSVAHLLTNGDSRSIALFGGLGLWAVLEIILINRRDGQWRRPDAAPVSTDFVVVIIAAVAFAVILYFHAWLFGVAPSV